MPAKSNELDDLSDPGARFTVGECLGTGVCANVYSAIDTEAGNLEVAVKIQHLRRDNVRIIQEELRVLKEFAEHPNLPDFYGAYKKTTSDGEEIWIAMELCEGGPVTDLVNGLMLKNRRMSEEHIAFILKEVVKALMHLHEHRVMHRDVRANNILLTKEGDVKLVDFGLSRFLSSTLGRSDTQLGSPCWMAPEIVTATTHEDDESGYGNRADVWALGITAIELADGNAPFHDMHPTRALFQIVRNPPPTLYRPAMWSDVFNDFINECLVKNPEHRPFMMELIDHPFFESVPENNYYLTQELKAIVKDVSVHNAETRPREAILRGNELLRDQDTPPEKMHVEDLAALENITEDGVLNELQARMKVGNFQTFVGDVLLILNPNEHQNIYTDEHHDKYLFKSRSDNTPHIYSVADSAYQNALHHQTTQFIILSGESGSGKTTNHLHLVEHLLHIGKSLNVNCDRIKNALKVVNCFTQASTPTNNYSTRCVMKSEIFYGRIGKVSGAVFDVYQLEKWRVSSMDMLQSNYNILYYFYDGIAAQDKFKNYSLSEDRNYRYMRIQENPSASDSPRYNPEDNVMKFQEIQDILDSFDLSTEQLDAIWNTLAAILLLGDVRFQENSNKNLAEVENEDVSNKVAELLKIDSKKLHWALTNYCVVNNSSAVRRRHTCDEARDARDVLANTLYVRVVDYIVNVLNHKLAYGRIIFGDKYSINIFDYFGFECFKENHLPQLMVNCLNEQLNYHYGQRVFGMEGLEMTEEQVPFTPLHYYDNKDALDQILGKPDGLFAIIDDASKTGHGGQYIIENLKHSSKSNIGVLDGYEFSIAHYTGKVTYNAKEIPDRNRDFLPPEIIETLRQSKDQTIRSFFSNKLTKTGNLSLTFDDPHIEKRKRFRWGASMSSEDESGVVVADSEQEYSQIKRMRTAVVTYKALSLYLLKKLSIGGGSGGTHFVRCIRADLQNNPRGFHPEVVRQQLRALSIVDTAKARQRGFPHRIPFSEFMRRYKFLAFDFDENVDVTKDNCRLLLIRLKMEGWIIGQSKVFLKYYNEEYLSRLYETQVKRIIKIQSMIRSFLAKRRIRSKILNIRPELKMVNEQNNIITEEQAALVIQKVVEHDTTDSESTASSGSVDNLNDDSEIDKE